MKNIPEVKIGLIVVSRDCFLIEASKKRRQAVKAECDKIGVGITEIQSCIENEKDIDIALEEMKKAGVNALVIYLGNFGPEGPTTILHQKFDGPVMYCAAAEETGNNLIGGRGDAYCGMLNASYNAGLRNLKPYIPEYPVGIPSEIAVMISDFVPVARVLVAVKALKIFAFGPRPHDFLACNAPIKPLYNLGVEIMENSELDLYDIYKSAEGNDDIEEIIADMTADLGKGNRFPDLLPKLAQYESGLLKFFRENLGASSYGIFANKCWPNFEKYFGFVPCYVNSRLTGKGLPVSCEVDIYGALSEYMITCATELPATILDINNTVPYDMIEESKEIVGNCKATDLFMAFHCGNTPSSCMATKSMKHQLIMHRLMEPGKEPDITRGTLEGTIKSGDITLFRLQSTASTELRSYVAEGEVLDIDPKSFGSIGVFKVNEMARFYRHVLIEKQYPHHAGIAFKHAGKALYSAVKMMGIEDVSYNKPAGSLYKNESPFM